MGPCQGRKVSLTLTCLCCPDLLCVCAVTVLGTLWPECVWESPESSVDWICMFARWMDVHSRIGDAFNNAQRSDLQQVVRKVHRVHRVHYQFRFGSHGACLAGGDLVHPFHSWIQCRAMSTSRLARGSAMLCNIVLRVERRLVVVISHRTHLGLGLQI